MFLMEGVLNSYKTLAKAGIIDNLWPKFRST